MIDTHSSLDELRSRVESRRAREQAAGIIHTPPSAALAERLVEIMKPGSASVDA